MAQSNSHKNKTSCLPISSLQKPIFAEERGSQTNSPSILLALYMYLFIFIVVLGMDTL
jgi:hypothetical protein